jgi:hypothetical protein
MPFYKNREQESKNGPASGLVPVKAGRMWGKGVGDWKWWKYYVFMYKNGRMRHVETIWGIGEGGNKG